MQIYRLHEGAPQDMSGRCEAEIGTYEFLRELGLNYSMADHDEAATMEDCEEIAARLETVIPKNLVLCNRQKTDFYLLIMDGNKPFKTKYLSEQIGSARLSFASAEDMERLLRVIPGSASLLSLLYDTEGRVRLLIDEPVLREKTLGFHPCRCTSTLRLSTEDLLNRFLPAVKHQPAVISLPEPSEIAYE